MGNYLHSRSPAVFSRLVFYSCTPSLLVSPVDKQSFNTVMRECLAFSTHDLSGPLGQFYIAAVICRGRQFGWFPVMAWCTIDSRARTKREATVWRPETSLETASQGKQCEDTSHDRKSKLEEWYEKKKCGFLPAGLCSVQKSHSSAQFLLRQQLHNFLFW